MNSWEDSIFSPMSIGGENEVGGVNSWEEMEAAAKGAAVTAGGVLMGLFLGWLLVPGRLGTNAPPPIPLTGITPYWWGRIELMKKSKAGYLMVDRIVTNHADVCQCRLFYDSRKLSVVLLDYSKLLAIQSYNKIMIFSSIVQSQNNR
jgi:hypothetical protein